MSRINIIGVSTTDVMCVIWYLHEAHWFKENTNIFILILQIKYAKSKVLSSSYYYPSM
jgi:hypothetical protein